MKAPPSAARRVTLSRVIVAGLADVRRFWKLRRHCSAQSETFCGRPSFQPADQLTPLACCALKGKSRWVGKKKKTDTVACVSLTSPSSEACAAGVAAIVRAATVTAFSPATRREGNRATKTKSSICTRGGGDRVATKHAPRVPHKQNVSLRVMFSAATSHASRAPLTLGHLSAGSRAHNFGGGGLPLMYPGAANGGAGTERERGGDGSHC